MAKIGVVIEGGDEFFKPLELHLRQAHQLTRFTPAFCESASDRYVYQQAAFGGAVVQVLERSGCCDV